MWEYQDDDVDLMGKWNDPKGTASPYYHTALDEAKELDLRRFMVPNLMIISGWHISYGA